MHTARNVAITEVVAEFHRAAGKHPRFNSAHEGFAVILEEVDELKAEVWKRDHDRDAMRKEAVQVAAMALRFLTDVCEDAPPAHPPQGTPLAVTRLQSARGDIAYFVRGHVDLSWFTDAIGRAYSKPLWAVCARRAPEHTWMVEAEDGFRRVPADAPGCFPVTYMESETGI